MSAIVSDTIYSEVSLAQGYLEYFKYAPTQLNTYESPIRRGLLKSSSAYDDVIETQSGGVMYLHRILKYIRGLHLLD